MKILIISDSHGLTDELGHIAKRHEGEVDLMIHCGDSELETDHPALKGYKTVKGNCDFIGDFAEELLLPLDGGRKLFLTHGHLHGIKQSLLQVYYRAEELGATVICFGHSHIPGSELIKGKLLINPGSIHLPRVRKEKSYAILTLDKTNAHVQFFTDEGQPIKELENNVTLESIS
ncbi:YfcE family phosphodiesterase [Bacillus sp. NPDC077027]|uniref:YfcE family phosphodiesterase n=1 Tax=Bacillus sp. NPDC077027 TaxID=3390548 RepID=UPI003D03F056